MVNLLSLSSRRAWIEIWYRPPEQYHPRVALLTESVDRNCLEFLQLAIILASLSSRRAWIEIETGREWTMTDTVALLTESVDRNRCRVPLTGFPAVALLTESVDRNLYLGSVR